MSNSNSMDFLRFALECGVLRFGDFTTKAGRQSPYFFNAGLFRTGRAMAELGRFYARAIVDSGLEFDLLFGPAYKGITLAAAASIALADHHDRDVPFAFNRKEAKDHGEGGTIIGAPLAGRVLVIDDVISAGTSVGESVTMIEAANASLAGVLISLDRQERGKGEKSATQEVNARHGVPVFAIAALADLIEMLKETPYPGADLGAIQAYRDKYGA